MLLYRRAFLLLVLSAVLIVSILFVRVHLTRRPLPDFLPNVSRFRSSVVCDPNLVILVVSASQNAQHRQVIRETWGYPVSTGIMDLSVGFGVGLASSRSSQRLLDLEAETFGDLFQVPFPSANKTEKTVALLQLVHKACSPKFVLKVEDDVFVNTLSLPQLFRDIQPNFQSKALWCLPSHPRNSRPTNVSNYCDGPVYLLTDRALADIVQLHDNRTSQTLPEDHIYVTGVLAEAAGVVHSQLGTELVHHRHLVDRKTVFAHLGTKTVDHTHRLWRNLVNSRTFVNRDIYHSL